MDSEQDRDKNCLSIFHSNEFIHSFAQKHLFVQVIIGGICFFLLAESVSSAFWVLICATVSVIGSSIPICCCTTYVGWRILLSFQASAFFLNFVIFIAICVSLAKIEKKSKMEENYTVTLLVCNVINILSIGPYIYMSRYMVHSITVNPEYDSQMLGTGLTHALPTASARVMNVDNIRDHSLYHQTHLNGNVNNMNYYSNVRMIDSRGDMINRTHIHHTLAIPVATHNCEFGEYLNTDNRNSTNNNISNDSNINCNHSGYVNYPYSGNINTNMNANIYRGDSQVPSTSLSSTCHPGNSLQIQPVPTLAPVYVRDSHVIMIVAQDDGTFADREYHALPLTPREVAVCGIDCPGVQNT